MYPATMEMRAIGNQRSVAALVRSLPGQGLIRLFRVPLLEYALVKSLSKVLFRIGEQVAAHNVGWVEMLATIGALDDSELDPNLVLRDRLESSKSVLLDLRTDLIKLRSDVLKHTKNETVREEFVRAIALTAEGLESINALQWAIAEHDADLAQRHEGFVATSAEEVSALLDRLSAGA